MADVQVKRLSAEVLAASPIKAGVTRQSIQAAMAVPGAVTVGMDVLHYSTEVLASFPDRAAVTRQTIQAALDIPGATTATASVLFYSFEVLGALPPKAAVTRQTVQLAMDVPNFTTANMNVDRFSLETLARSFIPMTTFALPTNWELFLHNWSKTVKLESAWNTDISSSSEDVSEERTALLQKPYRSLAVNWNVKGKEESNAFLVEMRRLVDETSVVPLYNDATELTSGITGTVDDTIYADFTVGRWFKDGPVIIVEFKKAADGTQTTILDHYEYAVIDSTFDDRLVLSGIVAATFDAASTVIMPLMKVHPQTKLRVRMINDNLLAVEAEFDEIYGETALPPLFTDLPPNFENYATYPILSTVPDWSRGITQEMRREGSQNSLGRGRVVYQRGARARVMHSLRFREDRIGGWDLIRFFESRRGRLIPFWVVDFENVFTVALLANPFVTVSSSLGTLADFQAEMQYIGLTFSDGVVVVREALTIAEVGGAWRITIDENIPAGYTTADVVGFGRARLCRAENDALLEEWTTTNVVELEIPVIELLDENEVTT